MSHRQQELWEMASFQKAEEYGMTPVPCYRFWLILSPHPKHFGFLLSQSPSVDFTASSLFPFLCYSVARPRTSPQQTSSAEFTVSYKTGLWTDFQCSSVKYVNRVDNHRGTSTYQDPSFKTIRNVPLFLSKKWPWHIFRFPIILYNFQLKSVL